MKENMSHALISPRHEKSNLRLSPRVFFIKHLDDSVRTWGMSRDSMEILKAVIHKLWLSFILYFWNFLENIPNHSKYKSTPIFPKQIFRSQAVWCVYFILLLFLKCVLISVEFLLLGNCPTRRFIISTKELGMQRELSEISLDLVEFHHFHVLSPNLFLWKTDCPHRVCED
jgi:hypothetical protein